MGIYTLHNCKLLHLVIVHSCSLVVKGGSRMYNPSSDEEPRSDGRVIERPGGVSVVWHVYFLAVVCGVNVDALVVAMIIVDRRRMNDDIEFIIFFDICEGYLRVSGLFTRSLRL